MKTEKRNKKVKDCKNGRGLEVKKVE